MESTLKKQIGKIIMLCIIAVFVSFMIVNAYKQRIADEALKTADSECLQLSKDLKTEGKTCICWYSNCKTENEYVNQKTEDYCMCKCLENDTVIGLCLRRAL